MSKRWWWWLGAAIIVLLVGVGLRHDAGLYSVPVAQVTSVQNGQAQKEVDSYNNTDYQTKQTITARLLNTEQKGATVHFTNEYTQSGALDSPLKQGNQVFLTKSGSGYQFRDNKRDVVLGVLMVITLLLICLLAAKHALVIIASITANTVLFFSAIHLDLHWNGNHAWGIFTTLVVIFTIVTVLFVIGWRPVGLVIAAATLLATVGAVGLGYAVMTWTNYSGIHLQQVWYVTQSPALLFYVEIIVGSLGAVLDETSDISVAIFQLNGGASQRFKAGMDIGRSVMGPLISVLFMIFIADTFAESVLWLRNGNSIAQTIDWVMGLGFAQSLISAFGIVLAVPITSGLAALAARAQRGGVAHD